MSSPLPRTRLPSWISVDMNDEVRQPSSSPPTRETGSSRRRSGAAVTPYIPRAGSPKNSGTNTGKRSHKQPSKVTPSTPWEERKHSRRAGRGAVVPRESYLVGLCRQQEWNAALLHLREHPEEAEPIKNLNQAEDTPFPLNLQLQNYDRPETKEEPFVYHETPLHLVCSFAHFNANKEGEDQPYQLVRELLKASPVQAIISHLDVGHTALRALVRNESCNPRVLRLLMDGMKNACSQDEFRRICALSDLDGLRPMDYIVLAFHQDTSDPLETLKVFVEWAGGAELLVADPAKNQAVSPLIRLLSLGNASSAARLTGSPTALNCSDAPASSPQTSMSPVLAHPSHHSKQVLEATKYFVKRFPLLLDHTSQTTKCTPLHVALRNYGNYGTLIQCFLLTSSECADGGSEKKSVDGTNEQEISPLILRSLQQENQFGDLPLHVASSVGVPVPILRLVLEGTLKATASVSSGLRKLSSTNLCWTVNNAGYTPIDLEWIRHMEDGKGLFMARSFYPLEAGGIKKTFWKQDEFYRVLLQQAVQQAMDVRATNPFLRALHSNNPQRIVNSSFQPGLMARSSNAGRAFATISATSRRTPRAGQVPPQQAPFQRGPPLQLSEQPTWELLLHRIFLITQTAATGQVPKTQLDLVDCLLHAASKLCFPVAPSLPLPLLELILFMYPEQLLKPLSSSKREDASTQAGIAPSGCHYRGNLPLHFAVQQQLYPDVPACLGSSFSSDDHPSGSCDSEAALESHQHICNEWENWCKQLLEHGPSACSTTNDAGQLPLHKALECFSCPCGCQNTKNAGDSTNKGQRGKRMKTMSQQEVATMEVVQALVDAFPNSVNAVDPISRLMPFQMAAASPFMPLDAVFYLLRRSPDAVLA